MRVLVLHGFAQTGEIARKKCKRLFRGLDVEVFYPDGPVEVTQPESPELTVKTGRAWFYLNPLTPGSSGEYFKRATTTWFEVERSLALLRELGHVDLVIGFSQGAMLARYAARELACSKICFISGVRTPEPENLAALGSTAHVSTLHCYGERDTMVLPAESLELASSYETARVFVHSAGHVIPTKSAFKQELCRLLHTA